jgi:hypothetical protein
MASQQTMSLCNFVITTKSHEYTFCILGHSGIRAVSYPSREVGVENMPVFRSVWFSKAEGLMLCFVKS